MFNAFRESCDELLPNIESKLGLIYKFKSCEIQSFQLSSGNWFRRYDVVVK